MGVEKKNTKKNVGKKQINPSGYTSLRIYVITT